MVQLRGLVAFSVTINENENILLKKIEIQTFYA